MQALHENAIVGEGDAAVSPLAKPLVEPLRDHDGRRSTSTALSKLWTAASEPLRLSVGYEVSLVVVDSHEPCTWPGRPCSSAGVAVAPTHGPAARRGRPRRAASLGDDLVVDGGGAHERAPPSRSPAQAGDPPGPAEAGR